MIKLTALDVYSVITESVSNVPLEQLLEELLTDWLLAGPPCPCTDHTGGDSAYEEGT
ncbi:MAG: hypothetical protein ACI4RE_02195 [Christensenellales bacterium]|nr:hypothetical protein [Clostridium sp.]MDD7139562.1 hypothetical protein [Clostridium sp.]MDY6080677.1 hypothetical protein [Eubacteriales bacterium]